MDNDEIKLLVCAGCGKFIPKVIVEVFDECPNCGQPTCDATPFQEKELKSERFTNLIDRNNPLFGG